MREVIFDYYEGTWIREVKGIFHCWGLEALESDKGNVSWTVAIIQLPSGKIVTATPNNVTFINWTKIR
jgi:hypothetical protein